MWSHIQTEKNCANRQRRKESMKMAVFTFRATGEKHGHKESWCEPLHLLFLCGDLVYCNCIYIVVEMTIGSLSADFHFFFHEENIRKYYNSKLLMEFLQILHHLHAVEKVVLWTFQNCMSFLSIQWQHKVKICECSKCFMFHMAFNLLILPLSNFLTWSSFLIWIMQSCMLKITHFCNISAIMQLI